jgi:uncharacterized protein DUF2877
MQALSIDAALLRSSRDGRLRGFVHSAFERVINVERKDGELFTIAGRDLDNAPATLIADAAGFTAMGITRGDRVDAVQSGIAIAGRLDIRLDGACAWDAQLPGYPADDSRLRGNLRKLRARIGTRAIGGGRPRGTAPSAIARGMAAALQRRACMLRAALCAGDLAAAGLHGKAMIGLGPGLTPSGDDFLVGLFATLHVPQNPCRELAGVCDDILVDVARRTNAISAAALQAAARGRVREVIQDLIRELVQGTPDRLAAALSRVLAIGSTSGTDIVAGMLCGFEVATGSRSGARYAARGQETR